MALKKSWVTIIVIIAVIILAIILLRTPSAKVDERTSICIGEKSELYTQLGCHACETQEEMFGEYYEHLNVIDCFYDRDKCDDIQYTPTWIIDGEKHTGVRSIEELKELTGC